MSSEQWKKENTIRYNVLVLKESGIPDALKLASSNLGVKPTTIIQIALREKLIRDGYLSTEPQTPKE